MNNHKFDEKHFRVAIFGSARTEENNPTYKLVFDLAKMIAKEEIDVITGGGPGLMQAANKGHHEGRTNNSVHSIGLTIVLPMEQEESRHLDIKKDFSRFSKRLDNFMTLSNAVVVAPGGIGTMLEFLYTWQLVQVNHICEIPIILLGEMWVDLIKWVQEKPLKKKLLSKEDLRNIFVVKSNLEAMKIIKGAKEAFDKGKGHVCTNLEKYK